MRAPAEGWRAAVAVLSLALLMAAGAAPRAEPLPPDAAPERIPVQVTLNTVPRGELFVWRDSHGTWIARDDAARLGVPIPGSGSMTIDGRIHFLLERIDGVRVRFDEDTLTLGIDVEPSMLKTQEFDLSRAEHLDITASPGFSGYLNYAFSATRSGSVDAYDAHLLANIAAAGWLARTEHEAVESAGLTQKFRLQSFVQRDWPGPMLRFIGGDFNTAAGPLSRGYALGGVSFGRAFELHPGLVTSPTAQITGIASTPSTAEVYVDGVLVATRAIAPGPYEFSNLQDFAGLRNVEVVIRDATGVRDRIKVPYYFSERILAEGYTDFNVAWGAQRRGTFSDTYDVGTFSGYVYHGFTDYLTLGLEAQRTSGYAFAAIAAGLRSDRFGVFSLDLAGQRLASGGFSRADMLNWRYTRGGTTLRMMTRGYSEGFRTTDTDTSLLPALELPRREYDVAWDQKLPFTLLLSLNAAERGFHGTQPPGHDYGASLSASLLGYGNISISGQRTCALHACTNQAAVNVSIPIGTQLNLNASYRRDDDGTLTRYAQLSRPVPIGEGYGWRATVQDSGGTRDASVDGSLRMKHGVLSASADVTTFSDGTRSTATRGSVEGSLACVGTSCYTTQPITDAFAVVDLSGVDDVRVFRNNEVIGRTTSSGEILLSNTPTLSRNDIRIADEDVPISIAVLRNSTVLVPAQGVGYRVTFDLRPIASVTGTLVMKDGDVPVTNVEIVVISGHSDPYRARTGNGGRFELDGIQAGRYYVSADMEQGACGAYVDVPFSRNAVYEAGVVRCAISAAF
jgi:outer membrane usher protein